MKSEGKPSVGSNVSSIEMLQSLQNIRPLELLGKVVN